MPMASLKAYLERLPARMAEVKMLLAEPMILPHLKKEAQGKMTGGWIREARGGRAAQRPVPAKLRLMGFAVRFERAEAPDEEMLNG